MSLWFVTYLGLKFPVGERNALVVLLGLGIKCFLLFIFVALGLERFIVSPVVFSIVVFFLCFALTKIRPIGFEGSSFERLSRKGFYEFSGFWIFFWMSFWISFWISGFLLDFLDFFTFIPNLDLPKGQK